MAPARYRALAGAAPTAVLVTLIGLGGLSGLTACDSSPSTGSAASETSDEPEIGIVQDDVHNSQDADFAAKMIVHHWQAITMTRLAPGRTDNAKVLDLARRIEAEQTPEIQELSRWLTGWGKPVPAAGAVPGSPSAAEVKALEAARNDAFDRAFLTRMISHHQEAVIQAKEQLKAGADERVKGLAEDIVEAQTAEIADMRTLLS